MTHRKFVVYCCVVLAAQLCNAEQSFAQHSTHPQAYYINKWGKEVLLTISYPQIHP
jgi:hypothetical protein